MIYSSTVGRVLIYYRISTCAGRGVHHNATPVASELVSSIAIVLCVTLTYYIV